VSDGAQALRELFREVEAERLTREKQDEFDIASGYHRRWQTAQATITEQALTIERLREALEWALGHVEHVFNAWALADWNPCEKSSYESAKAAIASLSSSDMRLVPVERLREIAELVNGLGYAPDWLADAIKENRV